jgi:hypothetical protein
LKIFERQFLEDLKSCSSRRTGKPSMANLQQTDANILSFLTASVALDPQANSLQFEQAAIVARLSLMAALHGDSVVTDEDITNVFPMGCDEDSELSLCYEVSTLSNEELTTRQRRLLKGLASEPGMEGAAGVDFIPRPGEFVQLITEGRGKHICGAMIFRLAIQEGRRRNAWERQRGEGTPGPTIEMRLAFRAAIVRRYPDPEQEQNLHVAIAAGQAQSLAYAVRRINEKLEHQQIQAWVIIGAMIDQDTTQEVNVNPSLLRVIQDGIDGQVIWLQEDGMPYQALDGIEALHDFND